MGVGRWITPCLSRYRGRWLGYWIQQMMSQLYARPLPPIHYFVLLAHKINFLFVKQDFFFSVQFWLFVGLPGISLINRLRCIFQSNQFHFVYMYRPAVSYIKIYISPIKHIGIQYICKLLSPFQFKGWIGAIILYNIYLKLSFC